MRRPVETVAALGLPSITGVLQVGANAGQELEYFVANGIVYGILIEPLDEPFSILKYRCAASSGFLPVQALCGSRTGDMVEMHVASNLGASSSILAPTGHLTDYPFVQFSNKVEMQTFSLDQVFDAATRARPEIAAACNLIYMDVQGAELQVLKGAGQVLHKIDYIFTEVGLGGGYENDVMLEDLVQFLRAFDFRLSDVEMNAEGWGDAMFVRRTGRTWGRRIAS
jgi:FkbM family methyltransferase